MTTYSAFFSSGLLAPRHATHAYPYYDAPSPVLPSSPLYDSDAELDMDREITPTPESFQRSAPAVTTSPNTVVVASQPRLRKRRSSLTICTTPMNAIRSPSRNAGAALQLQMHLPNPSRSRSGSVSTTSSTGSEMYNRIGMDNVASESTSLVGRMRSGSVGAVFRPRRGIRRLSSVPAPVPPPTAPLPAVPMVLFSHAQSWFDAPHTAPIPSGFPKNSFLIPNNPEPRAPLAERPSSDSVPGPATTRRSRGFSLSEGLRIDEEMKEN
ncbi:hypothetical protein H0H87_009723 [Tephrocybe sp. NHM501043]|nr:hypothetical protein H0H87_009723 [Tephrocybe sp. NHM501043]